MIQTSDKIEKKKNEQKSALDRMKEMTNYY